MKPVNSGSSIGLHKVSSEPEFLSAVEDIKQYSQEMLAEEFIDAREIECAVLGNNNPQVTVPGEVITSKEFYDHETKMYSPQNLKLEIPANLDASLTHEIQKTALEAFQICNCKDMARIDFFLTQQNKLYVNELNSIPGFADKSLYPILWEYLGKSRSQLLDELVELAKSRFHS